MKITAFSPFPSLSMINL